MTRSRSQIAYASAMDSTHPNGRCQLVPKGAGHTQARRILVSEPDARRPHVLPLEDVRLRAGRQARRAGMFSEV